MKKYDLHIHSKFSDGDYSVEEIVSKIRECGIDIFSITDHDNIESIKAMEKVDKRGLVYIPGVELSCEKDGYKMHILGYNIDANNTELIQLLQNMKLRKNLRKIGDFYNNPSFGYGGYCLPKDTKQLKANYKDVPENLITAIVNSNATRKQHIVKEILSKEPKIIGIYKLSMKKDSDNFRTSAIFDIIDMLIEKNKNIIIYEPQYENGNYKNCKIVRDIKSFKENSSIIIANRIEDELADVMDKVYTRDIYFRN